VKASVATNVMVDSSTANWIENCWLTELQASKGIDWRRLSNKKRKSLNCDIGVLCYCTNTLQNVPFTAYYLTYGTPNWYFLVNINFVPSVLFGFKADWHWFVARSFFYNCPSWRNEETKRRIFVAFLPKQLHSECVLLSTAAHRETQCLSCSASYCTVCNWTVLTLITQKLLLLYVQLHKRKERVQLLSSEVQCGRLFDTVCVYRQSYPEIRPFKEIRMIKNALPHPHSDM